MGRKPAYLKTKKISEDFVEEASREISEALMLLHDEPTTLEEIEGLTNFTEVEKAWVDSHTKALAEGKEVELDSQHKHLVKKRMMKSAWDWVRFNGVAEYFYDDIDEIIPPVAVTNAIMLHVAKNGQQSGIAFASAIEMGMKSYLKAQGAELAEIEVPVITRIPSEGLMKAVPTILGKAFEKFRERVEEEEKKKHPSPSPSAKTPEQVEMIRREKERQFKP